MGRPLLDRDRGYLGEDVEQQGGGDAEKPRALPLALDDYSNFPIPPFVMSKKSNSVAELNFSKINKLSPFFFH